MTRVRTLSKMILRDPVHGLVAFEGRAEQVLTALLETREVQRLRRVRQLGLTALVFPGAEHSRFAHALGTAHVMARLIERMRDCSGALPASAQMDARAAADALAAALLHDVGHGPFSHLFEHVLENVRTHEQWSRAIVLDSGTDVHRALEALDRGMAERVAAIMAGTHPLGYLARAVAGTIDVDRCDYLLRDSRMTGVSYGLYDLDWLLRTWTFAEAPSGEWVLAVEGRKGLPPVEGFFLGRHFMYRQVYHHKATRAAECLIRGIFERLTELVRDGSSVAAVPAAVRAAARGEPIALGDYLALDDGVLMTSFAEWEHSGDALLSDLASRFRRRALPKTVPLPSEPEAADARARAHAAAGEIAARRGWRTDLYVWLDATTDVPYPEPAANDAGGVWVALRHQPIRRLGDVSFVLGQLRNKEMREDRLVFPGEVRDEVESAVQGLLR